MFKITQGQNFQKLGAIVANGNPVDVTGWSVRMFLRSPCDGSFQVELTVTWFDLKRGTFQAVNPGTTTDYPLGRLILDTQVSEPGGQILKADPEPVQVEKL